jgi:hypothetical protein
MTEKPHAYGIGQKAFYPTFCCNAPVCRVLDALGIRLRLNAIFSVATRRQSFRCAVRDCSPEAEPWILAVTDDERAREVARLLVEALRLSDTNRLATVHYLLGFAAIEAAREVCVSPDPSLPPGVIPLRGPHPAKRQYSG